MRQQKEAPEESKLEVLIHHFGMANPVLILRLETITQAQSKVKHEKWKNSLNTHVAPAFTNHPVAANLLLIHMSS